MVLVEVVAEPMSLVPLVVMQMEKFEGKERAFCGCQMQVLELLKEHVMHGCLH